MRTGNVIAVTGTAPLGPDGKTVSKGNAAAQARRCLEIIRSAIEGLGGKLSDVTRARILLIRIEDWEQVAAVHGEFFGSIRPANTIMQVVHFIDPDWLVEIEDDTGMLRYDSARHGRAMSISGEQFRVAFSLESIFGSPTTAVGIPSSEPISWICLL